MSAPLGGSPLLTDTEVDMLACQFMNSTYADNTTYVDWPLDRRLDGFLRRRGLVRVVENGDAYDLVLNRVMAHLHRRESPIRGNHQ